MRIIYRLLTCLACCSTDVVLGYRSSSWTRSRYKTQETWYCWEIKPMRVPLSGAIYQACNRYSWWKMRHGKAKKHNRSISSRTRTLFRLDGIEYNLLHAHRRRKHSQFHWTNIQTKRNSQWYSMLIHVLCANLKA